LKQEEIFYELDSIAESDSRYKLEAYAFLIDALEYTMRRLGRRGHVSGRELLDGIRRMALDQFGPTARMVLESWGVRCTEDFGEIVFNLVDAGLLGKNEGDSREDFKGIYDFEEVFEKGFDWDAKGVL
jgi:uncharacterized repeat protein (TIGR04138 family)